MKQTYEEKLAALRTRFIGSADERVASIAQLRDEAAAGSTTALSDLHRLLHDMGGNAMMLSFESVGMVARKGQELVSGVERNGQLGELAKLPAILEELSEAIAQSRRELCDSAAAGSGGGASGPGASGG